MPPSLQSIPAINNACLATDSEGSSSRFYLVGSNFSGSLEVYYVESPSSTTVTNIASMNGQSAWKPSASKLCFIQPSSSSTTTATITNRRIAVIQFGLESTFSASIDTSSRTIEPYSLNGTAFLSPKHFSWAGKTPIADSFLIGINSSDQFGSNYEALINVQLNFFATNNITNSPITLSSPTFLDNILLIAGTYASDMSKRDYAIFFSKDNDGKIYTSPNVMGGSQGRVPLGNNPQLVKMNGVVLTNNALSVTAGETVYILDKSTNGSAVIYSISPNDSANLNSISIVGDSLPFTDNMVAAAFRNQILTYSISNNPTFNIFDIKTGKWSGNNLIANPVQPSGPNIGGKLPIGAIVGGCVGALTIASLVLLFFVRNRRRKSQKSMSGAEGACLAPDSNMFEGSNLGYIHSDQGYVPSEQAYNQYPSALNTPPLLFNNLDEDASHKECLTESKEQCLTIQSDGYVSPTSYRERSPTRRACESNYDRSDNSSSVKNNPQYIPITSTSNTDAQSP